MTKEGALPPVQNRGEDGREEGHETNRVSDQEGTGGAPFRPIRSTPSSMKYLDEDYANNTDMFDALGRH